MNLFKTLQKRMSKAKEPKENGLPPYADHNDLIRCTEIVRNELSNKDNIL